MILLFVFPLFPMCTGNCQVNLNNLDGQYWINQGLSNAESGKLGGTGVGTEWAVYLNSGHFEVERIGPLLASTYPSWHT